MIATQIPSSSEVHDRTVDLELVIVRQPDLEARAEPDTGCTQVIPCPLAIQPNAPHPVRVVKVSVQHYLPGQRATSSPEFAA